MRRQLIWALALVLATVGVATAQETTSGSIAGLIVDAQGAAVPGATVTLRSTQGTKTLVTDSTGRFFAPFLTPGTYAVKVELTGFSPVEQKNIDVRLGQRLELDLHAEGRRRPGGRRGRRRRARSSTPPPPPSAASSTAETLKRLPVGRNFTDTLYLVPGVSDSGGVGQANPSVAGASGLENNYVVDGVNITNTGYGGVGSYSIVFGSLGTGVTTRLHQGDPGQDRRLRGRVRPGHGRRRQRRHPERHQRVPRQPCSATSARRPGVELQAARRRPTARSTPRARRTTTSASTLGGPLMQGQAVLLRRLQPPVPDRDAHARPTGFPLAQPGRGRPQAQDLLPTPAS